MEIAGFQIANDLKNRLNQQSRIFIFSGPGNNGGDGLVVARWLFHWKFDVTTIQCCPPKTESCKKNQELLPPEMDLFDFASITPLPPNCIIIDSLLGNGQKSGPRGVILAAVQLINQTSPLLQTTIISIDTPTGRMPDNGCFFNGTDGISPDICYSIGAFTRGLFHRSLNTEIIAIDIALPMKKSDPVAHILSNEILCHLPKIDRNNAKWDKGHVAIAATGGAAILAAKAALRSGVGLVSIVCPEEAWNTLRELPHEIIVIEPSQVNPKRHNVLVVGPNWGFSPTRRSWVQGWWENFPNPLLIDADGITALADCIHNVPFPRVLTPHSAEASRILKWSRSEIEDRVFQAAKLLSHFGLVILKGPKTLVQSPNHTWICPISDSKLAIAGSGDVLSGLIGGFIAQNQLLEESVLLSVYIHAKCGTKLIYGDGASELISSIQEFIRLARDNMVGMK